MSKHPNLFFDDDDLPELGKKVQTGSAVWLYDLLIDDCDRNLLGTDFGASGWDGVTSIVHAHEIVRTVTEPAMAWVLSGEGVYRDLAIAALDRIVQWETWYASYEPTRGALIEAAATAYDWLYSELDAERRDRLRQKLAAEAAILAENLPEIYPPQRHDSAPPRTYCPLGLAGLVLEDDEDSASAWIRTAKTATMGWLDFALDADGAPFYSSDTCYFTVSMHYLLCLAHAFQRRGDSEILDHPKLRLNRHYLLYRMEPRRDGHSQFCVYNRIPLFMDHLAGIAGIYTDGLAQWHYLHTQGPEGRAHRNLRWGGRNGMDDITRAIIWHRDVAVEEPDSAERLDLGKCFRESGKVVMRTGFESDLDFYLALECGPAIQGWSHADQGSFVLNAYGQRFIDDPGVGGGIDWSGSPQAHNLVQLDGIGPSAKGGGSIATFLHTLLADYCLADQTDAYRLNAPVTKAHRHVLFVRPSCFFVVDELESENPVALPELLLHSGDGVQDLDQLGPAEFMLRGEGADLRILFAEPYGPPTANARLPQTQGVMVARHELQRRVVDEMDKDCLRWFSFFPAARRTDAPREALFVALYRPEPAQPEDSSSTMAPIRRIENEALTGFRIGDRQAVWWNRTDGEASFDGFPGAEIRTDARLAYVSEGSAHGDSGRRLQWLAAGFTRFAISDAGMSEPGTTGGVEISSDQPIVAVRKDDELMIQVESESSVSVQSVSEGVAMSLAPGEHRFSVHDNHSATGS